MNNIYIYDLSYVNNYDLPLNILEHVNRYKIEKKRNISNTMYYLLGLKLENIGLSLVDLYFFNNKPLIKGINISLSHSDHYICIMISDDLCGIDTEPIINKNIDKLKKLILNDKDIEENIDLELTNRCTLLESYYKIHGGNFFDLFNKDI